MTTTLTFGHTYRFRTRAIDKVGNIGAYAYGPSFGVLRYEETVATYSAGWAAGASSNLSGGHERVTGTNLATATFRTTARTMSWVALKAASRGTAQVFVDGVLAATVNLHSTTTTYRYVAFSVNFASSAAHTIQIVYTGTSSQRLDVDAFIVLR